MGRGAFGTVEAVGPRVLAVDGHDLPVGLALVDHAQHAQHLRCVETRYSTRTALYNVTKVCSCRMKGPFLSNKGLCLSNTRDQGLFFSNEWATIFQSASPSSIMHSTPSTCVLSRHVIMKGPFLSNKMQGPFLSNEGAFLVK